MSPKKRLDPRLVSLTAAGSFAAEQYQGLRLTLERLGNGRGGAQALAVTSPAAGDGKTVTAINLAGTLARGSEARVLLVDADLRRPAVGSQLRMDASARGLTDVLTDDRTTLDDVTTVLEQFNLSVIPAGTGHGAVHQMLRSARFERLLKEARERYDFIVLDTPPLLPVYDSALLAKSLDGVLMVVSANRTPRKLLGEALNLLEAGKVLGIVFNKDGRPLFGYYDSYYREYFPTASVSEA
ncbi:MAG TPA: CpsD/CapB family tyrosine-protein kinase [Vicinamibacterales bacterium]|jgi:capsular exopolysaccharide synthesis family protein|nr:CpsD/CapB family tyrosine-protein kinase [Vicinamibacterales bacterium]